MTRDEAVAKIQEQMGFHTGLVTTIQNQLIATQNELERAPELPWFLKSEYSTIQTQDGEERVPIPTDFLRELEEEDCLYLFDSAADVGYQWTPLEKVQAGDGRYRYPGSGSPKLYSLDNKYFRVYPTPDDNYTLKMQYYKADTELSSNIENLWLAHRPYLLIGRAGMHVASAARDQTALQFFAGLYQVQLQEMTTDETARKEANTTRQRGEAD